MKTVENKDVECENVEQKNNNKWKFLIGMAVGIILYVSYQFFFK